MKKILFILILLIFKVDGKTQNRELLFDYNTIDTLLYNNRSCSPNPSLIICNNPTYFNITNSGYVGNNPTSGDAGCNPCCYSGSDLDCDGLQDVSFSVENSIWYSYCNNNGSNQILNVIVDEPGSGSSCNLQGAIWVGTSLNSITMDCGNSEYTQFGSNPGGAADGFSFSSISIPNGQCVYIIIDGYAGSTCNNVSIIIQCLNSLPIELLSFNGKYLNGYNHLTWVTVTETNNDYFAIERSIDGVDWIKVDTIDGYGTTNTIKIYSLVDKEMKYNMINYYRLKQTDINGKTTVHQTISINNIINKPKLIRTYNYYGQEVNEYYRGVVIEFYDNGINKIIVRD